MSFVISLLLVVQEMISGTPSSQCLLQNLDYKSGEGPGLRFPRGRLPRSGVRTPMGKCSLSTFTGLLLPKPFSEQWRRDSWRRGARLPLDAERGASRESRNLTSGQLSPARECFSDRMVQTTHTKWQGALSPKPPQQEPFATT